MPHRSIVPPSRVAILAILVPLAACVGDGSSSDAAGSSGPDPSSGAASGDDDGSGPGPGTTVGSSGDDTSTGSPDATTDGPGDGSADTTAAVDDSSGSDGPACDPSDFTEVRGCPEVIGDGFCSEGAEHVPDGTDIMWMADPPHSGPHYPMWEIWGEHDTSVARGNWVHNLEHGGIVLAYLCPGGCEAELDVLRDVIAARPNLRILMTSDPELPGPRFAAISWTWVYRTDAPDLDTLLCFVDQHENHAPEDVP